MPRLSFRLGGRSEYYTVVLLIAEVVFRRASLRLYLRHLAHLGAAFSKPLVLRVDRVNLEVVEVFVWNEIAFLFDHWVFTSALLH